MKILLCHNYYQHPGGEDRVFADESRLLESRGHAVLRFTLHNDAIRQLGRWKTARRAIWNPESYAALRELIRRERPHVLHCTNCFPLISPAAHHAAYRQGLPVVQSLHNYRLLCANALFFRNGQPCEACLAKSVPWPAVVYGCYRGSRLGTAVVAASQVVHRLKGTWSCLVDRYVVPSHFARRKFVEQGLPAEKLAVKPNFVDPDPGPGEGRGGYAIFVGRLSPEKGIDLLLAAWRLLKRPLLLKVVGDGPLAEKVSSAAACARRVQWLGRLPFDRVLSMVGEAACLVFPSVCYETFGRAIVESFAKGTPVLVPRTGAMAELVDDGRTGRHFEPGSPADLAARVRQLVSDLPALARMRREARREYERRYSAERNYAMLMEIYERVLNERPRQERVRLKTPRVCTMITESDLCWPRKKELFGVRVSVTTCDEAAEAILQAAGRRLPAVVSLHPVHGLVTASGNGALRRATNTFEIVAPDGQPVRWALNLFHRAGLRAPVTGFRLMLHLCHRAAEQGVPIYLYGSSAEVLQSLRANLEARFPKLSVAGAESPPFRPLTPEEDQDTVNRINDSGAGIVFVGLGYPKQDYFALKHRGRIRGVLVCVGAAFDFHSGHKRRAPGWMQRHGLEWLYRLSQEPRRLWRRYLATNTVFLVKLALALVGLLGPRNRALKATDHKTLSRTSET